MDADTRCRKLPGPPGCGSLLPAITRPDSSTITCTTHAYLRGGIYVVTRKKGTCTISRCGHAAQSKNPEGQGKKELQQSC